MDIDFEQLAAMVELLKSAEFTEFRYEKGDVRIVIRRGDVPAEAAAVPAVTASQASVVVVDSAPRRAAAPTAAPTPAPTAATPPAGASPPEGCVPVTAPLLGTFYARPKPGEAAFVQVGDRVDPDAVLCIVEVMKLMNSVHAGVHGIVAAVHAKDGELVEFGQTLFSIQPDAR